MKVFINKKKRQSLAWVRNLTREKSATEGKVKSEERVKRDAPKTELIYFYLLEAKL